LATYNALSVGDNLLTLDAQVALTAGNLYWIEYIDTTTETGTNYFGINYQNTGNVYTSGNDWYSTNGGATWTQDNANYDIYFKTWYNTDYCGSGVCDADENCSSCATDCGSCTGSTTATSTTMWYYITLPDLTSWFFGTSTVYQPTSSPTSTYFLWPTSTSFMDNSLTQHFDLYYLLFKFFLGGLVIWLIARPKRNK